MWLKAKHFLFILTDNHTEIGEIIFIAKKESVHTWVMRDNMQKWMRINQSYWWEPYFAILPSFVTTVNTLNKGNCRLFEVGFARKVDMVISEIPMNVLFQFNRGRGVFRALLNICDGVFRKKSKCWKPLFIFAKSFTIKIFGSSLNMFRDVLRSMRFKVQYHIPIFPEMGIYVVAQERKQKSKQQKPHTGEKFASHWK